MVDDQIFREVDEELRREKWEKLWQRYGTYFVLAAVGVVAIAGGIIGYQKWQVSQRQSAGDEFISALKLESAGKEEDALKRLQALSDESTTGYELLASLHLAARKASVGQSAEAELLYKKIAVDPSADKLLLDYAKLNLALLRLDGASFEETSGALAAFTTEGGAWRSTALEVVALAALKENNLDEASERFRQILDDRSSPSALRRRAQIMLDVIATRKAQQQTG